MTRWLWHAICMALMWHATTGASLITTLANITTATDYTGHLGHGANEEAGSGADLGAGITNDTLYDRVRTARRSSVLTDVCTTTEGNPGTCTTRFNCMRQGGTVRGFCSSYGVCCEIASRCGSVSRSKRTVINSPSSYTSTNCMHTIERYSANVCQLLIEFTRFELTQPALDNSNTLTCSDYFHVGEFAICGTNTGQHLYVHLDTDFSLINLEFVLPSRSGNNRYNLVVTQLECPKKQLTMQNAFVNLFNKNYAQDIRTIFATHNHDVDLLAPFGCDQYYREATGTIRTFNYQNGLNSYYMPNMNYVICIKPVKTANNIHYTANSFSLSSNNPLLPGIDDNCRANVVTLGRREDYLMIPHSNEQNNPLFQSTYYCGTYMANTPIIAFPPYIMYFNSDEITDETETGFSITYTFA